MWVVVPHMDGSMTAFSLHNKSFGPGSPATRRVLEVLVQERWYNRPTEMDCGPDWRRL